MLRLISMSAAGALLAACATTTPPPEASATSAALADAETRACAGISQEDRNKNPLSQSEAIANVAPLMVEEYPRTNPPLRRMAGAVVTLRAEPGMTAEWLQRWVDCQLASGTPLAQSAELADSPLAQGGTVANVRSIGNGFAIEIGSNDRKVAREILAKAQKLYQQRQLAVEMTAPRDTSH